MNFLHKNQNKNKNNISLPPAAAEMTNGTATEKKLPSCCCIVHEFYKAAKKNPNKIAVIHAHGGAKIAAEFHRIYSTAGKNTASEYDDKLFEEFLAKKTLSPHPPVYEGDECFTFSDIVAAVDSLSSRIRTIIDGGDDPFLIKPTTGNGISVCVYICMCIILYNS